MPSNWHPIYHNKILTSIILGASVLLLASCGSRSSTASHPTSTNSSSQTKQISSTNDNAAKKASQASYDSTISYQHHQKRNQKQQAQKQRLRKHKQAQKNGNDLAYLNYHSGEDAYINVNNGKSTLQPRDWKTNNVEYADLDGLNRASAGNTADLESHNLDNDSLRKNQTFHPTGYRQKFIYHHPILNRGHEIAYSLSKGINASGRYDPKVQAGDQDNPKNLFTQTAFSNQRIQTIYESKVRDALRQGKKVIYQVKPIFYQHDLMAKGVHMQAISTDSSLDYNVYIYNVQPGIRFNYSTGRSKVDHQMNVPTPIDAPNFVHSKHSRNASYMKHNHPYKHKEHYFNIKTKNIGKEK